MLPPVHACERSAGLKHTINVLENSLYIPDFRACRQNEFQSRRTLIEVELVLVGFVKLKTFFAAKANRLALNMVFVQSTTAYLARQSPASLEEELITPQLFSIFCTPRFRR